MYSMPQDLVTPEEFLTRLKQEFASDPSSSGTVWLTHKRYTHGLKSEEATMNDDSAEEYEVLIRCTHNDTKFSSRIPSTSLLTFTQTYSTLLKSSLAPSMRKRDKKREKAKAEVRDKKRKEVYVDVEIGDGGKRGAGHRQRTRKVAAQRKKEAEREKIETRESKRDL